MTYDDWKTETPEDEEERNAAALRKLLGNTELDPDRLREDREDQ